MVDSCSARRRRTMAHRREKRRDSNIITLRINILQSKVNKRVVRDGRLERTTSSSQSRRATNCATPGYSVYLSGWAYSPKAGALPTALYPDISFFCMIPCEEGKSKFFVSVGNAVVKPNFARIFQPGNFHRKLLSQGLPGFRFWGNG